MTKEIKVTRRIISLVMCLLMIVSIMPVSVSAAGEKVGGVKAVATKIHNVAGAYMPEFTTLKVLDPSGAVTGYMPVASYLYTDKTASSYVEAYKLKTAPEEGKTYYAYITIPATTGANDVKASLVEIEIEGYDIEFLGASFSGYNVFINYTIRKTARVCGVEAEASGVEYNSSLSGYAPVFTKLESVMSNGSVTGYNAKTGVLYKSYTSGTWGEKLTTAPVEGASYYSYIDLQNPLGIHYIEDSLVDIEIDGYDVEFVGAYERDMGFSIMVVYSIVHKTHTGGTATCTEKAKCSVCGEAYGSTKSHNLQKVAAVKPTCTEKGTVEHYKCTVCGKLFSDAAGKTAITDVTAKATGHKLQKVAAVKPTCTEKGTVEHYKCTVCGKLFSDAAGKTAITDTTVKATGHSYEWVVTKPAQVGVAGEQALTCKVCKDVKEKKTIPALEAEYMLGDVDFNKKVDATDARLALRAAVGLEKLSEKAKKAADVDKNSAVNATDARLILRAAVGLEILK